MPSSYTSSARFVLQATGENNNTWGVILNQGAFQLIDDNINGHLGLALSGSHTLALVQGATDEARMAFLDVTGGSGGTLVIPQVPKGYFVRNAAAGAVSVSTTGPTVATFKPGDIGPCFSDGAAVYPLLIGGLTIQGYADNGDATVKAYVDTQDAAIYAYINSAITSSSDLPPAVGQLGKTMMVRSVSGTETWVADFIKASDVQGATGQAVAFALTL